MFPYSLLRTRKLGKSPRMAPNPPAPEGDGGELTFRASGLRPGSSQINALLEFRV